MCVCEAVQCVWCGRSGRKEHFIFICKVEFESLSLSGLDLI